MTDDIPGVGTDGNPWQQVIDMGWKCWYQSKGICFPLAGLILSACKLFWPTITQASQQSLADLISLIIMAFCFAGAIWGRFFAKTRIGTPELHAKIETFLNPGKPQ